MSGAERTLRWAERRLAAAAGTVPSKAPTAKSSDASGEQLAAAIRKELERDFDKRVQREVDKRIAAAKSPSHPPSSRANQPSPAKPEKPGTDVHRVQELEQQLAAANRELERLRAASRPPPGEPEHLVDPKIDPSTLSLTAQQKLDIALRQYKKQLDLQFKETVRVQVLKQSQEHIDEWWLPKHQKMLDDAEQVLNTRRGFMTRSQYNTVLKCLHSDTLQSAINRALKAGGKIDPEDVKRYDQANHLWRELEIVVLSEKDSPYDKPPSLPRSWAEMEAARAKVRAANSARSKAAHAARKAKNSVAK